MSEKIKLKITDRQGHKHDLDVEIDSNTNLMEFCRDNSFGVEGFCGGMGSCASCHIHIESREHYGNPDDDELAMLDDISNSKTNSRLGCQIEISKDIDGIKFEIAQEP